MKNKNNYKFYLAGILFINLCFININAQESTPEPETQSVFNSVSNWVSNTWNSLTSQENTENLENKDDEKFLCPVYQEDKEK